MSQRVTKCNVSGQADHTRSHCLVMCGSCSGDSRNCDCQQTPAKKQKTKKGKRAAEKEQPQVAAAAGSPESEPNYKSICRQLQQKRLPRHSRAENCQRSDIWKHPGEAGRPQTVCKKD